METQDSAPIVRKTGASSTLVDMHAAIADVFAKLAACTRSIILYGGTHPLIEEMADSAHGSLTRLLAIRPEVAIAVTDSYLALDSFPIADNTGGLRAFAGTLSDRGIGELQLSVGVSRDELIRFAQVLAIPPEALEQQGGVSRLLRERGIMRLRVKGGAMPTESRPGRDPADIYEEALLLAQEAMMAVQAGLEIPVPEIRAVVADSLHCLVADEDTFLALTDIRSYDRYLWEHSVNVCILAMVLSKNLGLDSTSVLELGISAMLHDVGKVFVPGEVVKKPGKLTEEEWEQIRRHPVEGARVLAGLEELPPLASTVALEHHIRCDGSGYPSIPVLTKPHLLSRLVAIVDSYDALTTNRPYRKRWSPHQAIAWMLYEGKSQYDRQLMARFASWAGLYPAGALVRLAGGDTAVVIGGTYKYPKKPVVKLLTGRRAAEPETAIIDLSKNNDPAFSIVSVAQPVEVLLPYGDKLMAA